MKDIKNFEKTKINNEAAQELKGGASIYDTLGAMYESIGNSIASLSPLYWLTSPIEKVMDRFTEKNFPSLFNTYKRHNGQPIANTRRTATRTTSARPVRRR